MSKPSDIPQDVFEVAVGIARDLPARVQPANRDFAANVIAQAIMAERRKAADRVDTLRESLMEGLMTDAGLTKADRIAMNHQLEALAVASKEIRGEA